MACYSLASNSTLSIYLQGLLRQAHQDVYTMIFITVVFITAKYWKLSKYPSVGDCLNKVLHPYYGMPCRLLKRMLQISICLQWKDARGILLSEKKMGCRTARIA